MIIDSIGIETSVVQVKMVIDLIGRIEVVQSSFCFAVDNVQRYVNVRPIVARKERRDRFSLSLPLPVRKISKTRK